MDWIDNNKLYAAMIHRLDQNIERLMQSIKELGLDENTIVFFCSDNGPRGNYSQHLTDLAEFFDSNGPLRGYKRDLYEGGVRVPMIVRWPGKIRPGSESDVPWCFTDIMPTLAELARIPVPEIADGVSVMPVLLERDYDHHNRYLYWEFYEGGFKQSVRWKNWKGIRMQKDAALELYNLDTDLSEEHDIASEYPEIVTRIEEMMAKAHVESENYPLSEY
jgi:arylsulfatase A-like enzyme